VLRKKRPHVATMNEVRITRDGAYAIIAYEDDSVATTQYHWNAGLATKEDDIRSRRDMGATLSRTNTVNCFISESPNDPHHPFLAAEGRTFTAMELAKLLGAHAGWTVRIELVPPESGGSVGD
jgi:hypothetical protein